MPKENRLPLFDPYPISLLTDDSCKSKKGTCPSDLATVLSQRHNTHLVTLSSMSVAH